MHSLRLSCVTPRHYTHSSLPLLTSSSLGCLYCKILLNTINILIITILITKIYPLCMVYTEDFTGDEVIDDVRRGKEERSSLLSVLSGHPCLYPFYPSSPLCHSLVSSWSVERQLMKHMIYFLFVHDPPVVTTKERTVRLVIRLLSRLMMGRITPFISENPYPASYLPASLLSRFCFYPVDLQILGNMWTKSRKEESRKDMPHARALRFLVTLPRFSRHSVGYTMLILVA